MEQGKKIVEDDQYVLKGEVPIPVLPNISLGQIVYQNLLIQCAKRRNKALISASTEEYLSYKELLGKSCSLANALQNCSYGKNSIFTICSQNSLEFYVPVYAALYMGAIMAPINHLYTPTELEHCLNISKPRIIFCSKEVASKFVTLRAHLKFIERIITLDNIQATQIDGTESLMDFIQKNCAKFVYNFDPVPIEDVTQQVALIMCSSGTTGLPKGVMLTHWNVAVRYYQSFGPQDSIQDENNVVLAVVPFFHAYGLIVNLISIARGYLVVFLPQFDPNIFLGTIQKYRVQQLWLAPPLVVFMAKHALAAKYDLSSVRDVICGAAPLSDAIEMAFNKRLGRDKVIRQGYGLTEVTLAVTRTPMGEYRSGSCGQIMEFMEIKVRDPDTGRSLPYGQVGELCLRGPMVMKGYYQNSEATRATITEDGWLRTGDLGYYDQDKYFYIVDRLKELIKYKGYQVPPAELEGILLKHPEIRDVGVIGLPSDPTVGELPLAFVVKDPKSKLTAKAIEDYIAGLVSPQKRLRGGVIFLDEIPKNASGKILRRQLRTMLSDLKKSKL